LSLATLALAAIVAWTFGGARPADAAPLRAAKSTASAATAAAAGDAGADDAPAKKRSPKELTGKLNVNTASEDQLMLLPGVGPAMSERIVGYRTKNGAFKRIADLRKVKGIGYKTLKKLEPYLDVKGDTTLAEK
jgi:competence protein ComEA